MVISNLEELVNLGFVVGIFPNNNENEKGDRPIIINLIWFYNKYEEEKSFKNIKDGLDWALLKAKSKLYEYYADKACD